MSQTFKLILTGLGITLAVFLLSMQLPQFSLLVIIIPVIYLWLGFRLKANISYIAGSIFFVITTLLVAHPYGMMVGLFGGLIPTAMTIVAKRDYLEDALVKTVILCYAALLSSHYFLNEMHQIDLFVSYQAAIRLVIDQMQATGSDTSGLFNTLSESYLSVLFMLATAFAVVLFILAALLRHYKAIEWQVQPFYTFRFKGMNFFQFGLVMLAIFGLGSLELPYRLVGQNGWRFMMTLFSIQGISVAYFYLKRRKVAPPISWFLLTISLALPLVNSLISLIGFSDSLFDFRKLEALK